MIIRIYNHELVHFSSFLQCVLWVLCATYYITCANQVCTSGQAYQHHQTRLHFEKYYLYSMNTIISCPCQRALNPCKPNVVSHLCFGCVEFQVCKIDTCPTITPLCQCLLVHIYLYLQSLLSHLFEKLSIIRHNFVKCINVLDMTQFLAQHHCQSIVGK